MHTLLEAPSATHPCLLVFRKTKDLYLIIMQKLIILKSGGVHEIWWISGEIHPRPYKIRCFNKNSSVWGVHGGGYDPRFHEIWGHSPSPAFIKLDSFGWNTCFYKVLGGFHMKSAGFHLKSARFHADFMKSGGFHVKSKDPLARNCNPMFILLLHAACTA